MTRDNADNAIKAGSAGAIERVVATMRAHIGHAGVQECGRVFLDRMGHAMQ